MEIIKFNNWNKKDFIDDLRMFTQNKDFFFDDILCHNLEEFFKFIFNSNEEKEIILHKFEDIDLILERKCIKFFKKYNREFLSLNIKFKGFSQEEICSIISEELYFLYCNKYDIKFCKTNKLIKEEFEKLSNFSPKLFKYLEFDVISKFYNKTDRYSYFNFPVEKGLDRFVFYFLINTDDEKTEIEELFKTINLNEKCQEIFSKISICENGSLFAIGFNYYEDKLVRTTIYSRFNVFSSKRENDFFLKKHFGLKYNSDNNLFVKDWGVDFFEFKENVVKIYFKETNFKKENKHNSELIKVLNNKASVGCFKFINSKLVDEKFEFSNNLFSREEIKILGNLNIYDKNSKLFSIYFDENEKLKNSVNYNI